MAVFGLLASGTITLVLGPIAAAGDAAERGRAVFLAEEGIEAARSIRDESWTLLAPGAHGLARAAKWSFSGPGDAVTDGNLTYFRTVTVEPVGRDISGNVVTSGGSVDPRTRLVTAQVTWTSFLGIARSVRSSAYLTHGNAFDWLQTTDVDFGPGSKNGTAVVGSGASASVQLAPATVAKSWTSAEGNLIVHKDSALWGSGTFTDTQVVGSDPAATIQEKGSPRWIQIYAGSTFFQTTDTDFATGAFSNTVVAGTGDLGAVILNSGSQSWAAQASPVTAQLSSVAMTSSTDGWAVGAGGTIVRWDGTNWTQYPSSPTARALTDISMVSAAVGYAVGGNGAFIKWNGAAWTSQTSVPRVMVGLDAVSENQVWAAGNSGYLYFWNGSSWSGSVRRSTQTWTSIDMVSPTDGWAVGAGGGVVGCHAVSGDCSTMSSWTLQAYTAPRALSGVSCASTSLCFAVGNQGQISYYNGTAWSNFASPTANTLYSVHMISATDGWAVGAGGAILRWDGTAWSVVSSPDATAMAHVFALSSSEAYAVGAGGVIWQYGSHYFLNGTYVSRVFDAGSSVTWGHIFWNESLPDLTDLTIATRSGNTPTPDVTWSAWSAQLTDPTNSPVASPAGRYFQYWATLSTTNAFATPRLNSVSIYYNEPALGSFFDVKVTAPADGWAVGRGGQIARFDGMNWSDYGSSPTTDSLLDVDLADASRVWAVGAGGRIIYWNGTSWAAQTSPTTRQLNGIDVVSAASAYAVGAHGTFVRYSGGAWSSQASPTIQDINAVSMISDSDGWAVGSNGAALRWNGAAWSVAVSGPSNSLNGVFMVSSADGWAVGAGGRIIHWNGTAWSPVASSTPNELRDIWCTASDDCWAVGVQATFLHWDGTTWSGYILSTTSNPVVQGVHMTSPTEGWAVGEGGAIYHYTAVFPATAYWQSPVVDGGTAGIKWNTISWDSLEPMGTGLQVATRTGSTPAVDPSWSAWSAPLTDKGGSTIASPDNQYLQYQVIFSTSVTYNTAILQQVRLINGAATGQNLYDVDGSAANDVWAVGRSGTIIRYDGASWQPAASPTNRSLNGIDVLSATEAFAVGDSGTFIRLSTGVWSLLASPTAQDMYAVSMLSPTYGAAVGSAGTVAVWDGTAWTVYGSLTGNALRGVHLYSSSLGAAVGDGGVIFMWDGTVWSAVASPTASRLNAVHFIAADLGWAVGDGGVILKWNGSNWSTAVSPTMARLSAVESRSATEAWAAGDFGLILRYDGTNWTSFASPTSRNLFGITVQAPTDGWICGQNGSLLKDPAPYMTYGTFVSTVLDTGAASVFDTMFWNVSLPAGTAVTVATRSGNTPAPDGTWSAWTAEYSAADGAPVASPPARYLQYRASLNTSDDMQTPDLNDITLTYRQ